MSSFETSSPEGLAIGYEILAPRDFFEDFSVRAKHASGRVLAQTMYVEDGRAFDQVADALIDAASRGLETGLHVDAYSELILDQHIQWMPQIHSSARRENANAMAAKLATLVRVAEYGVPVLVTNPPNTLEKALPFMGRNHTKIALVDDIAWIGGLSYRDADLTKEDFMMRITDPRIVATLEEVFYTTDYTGQTSDKLYDLGDTKIIVDSGLPGQSAVFDRGLRKVRGASESIRLISQYSPNGKMAAMLAIKAAAGFDVLSVTSSNESIDEWFGALCDRASSTLSHLRGRSIPTAYSQTRVHAKGLLVDADNPDRVEGMVGSHNLTRVGAILGTQEIGLFSSNPDFVKSLRDYFARVEGRIALEQMVGPNNEN